MKKIVLLFLFFLLLSCNSEDLSETYVEKVKVVLKQNSTTNPVEEFSLFFEDLSYGSQARNKFDLFLPQDGNAKGIVVFFMEEVFYSMTKVMLTKSLMLGS